MIYTETKHADGGRLMVSDEVAGSWFCTPMLKPGDYFCHGCQTSRCVHAEAAHSDEYGKTRSRSGPRETYTAEQYAKDMAEFMGRERNPADGSTWCARSDACILGYGHKGACCVDPMDVQHRQ